MYIANPIYDVAFKHLLQNKEAARLLIAKITGLAVESVEFRPQEVSTHRPGVYRSEASPPDLATPPERVEDPMLTLFRMDFSARITTDNGQFKQVLIEIQKAKAPTVIERFRIYLGSQYMSKDNSFIGARGASRPIPIITIYLLGYDLGISDEAVLDVTKVVTERRTKKTLETHSDFIEGTNHDSYIVQIPKIKAGQRDDLERFLSVFDQSLVVQGINNQHTLSIDAQQYPAEYQVILQELRKAIETDEVRRYMEGEDLLLKDSIMLSHSLALETERADEEKQRADEEKQRADEAELQLAKEKRHARLQQQRARQQQQRAEQEQQRAEAVEQQLIEERKRAKEMLVWLVEQQRALGLSDQEIADRLSISLQEVKAT